MLCGALVVVCEKMFNVVFRRIDLPMRRRYTLRVGLGAGKTSGTSATRNRKKPSMAYSDFQEILARLEREGELKRISTPVDPHLEITEIADRVMKMPDGGPALLFEKPKGSDIPLAIN